MTCIEENTAAAVAAVAAGRRQHSVARPITAPPELRNVRTAREIRRWRELMRGVG
jgi:hypothetical protein